MYAEADTLEDYIREKMKAYEMLKNFEKQHQSNPSDKWSTKDEEKLARASQKYNDLVAVYNDLIAKEREAASAASDYGSKMSAFFSSAEKIGFLNAAVSSLRNNLLNTSASIANLTSAGGTFYSMFSQIHPAIGAFGGLVLTAGTGVARLTGGIAKLVGQGLLKLGKIGAKRCCKWAKEVWKRNEKRCLKT